jgi:cell volume regulation protein A
MIDLTFILVLAAVMLLVGFLGDALFRKTGFPDILFLLLLGIIMGPVLGLFSKNDLAPVTPYLVELALIMILFYAGMDMNITKVIKRSGRATILAVAYFVLVTIAVSSAAKFLLNIDWLLALMFGPMIAGTSSIVVIPLCKKLIKNEETAMTLSLESTITDVLNIVFFFSVLNLYLSGNFSLLTFTENLLEEFGIGILFGFLGGIVWIWVLYRIRKEPYTYISTLAVLILTVMGSQLLGGSGVLSAFAMGLMIGNHKGAFSLFRIKLISPIFEDLKENLTNLHSELTFLFRTFFFVFLGLIYDISYGSVLMGLTIGLIFLAINLSLRYVSVRLAVLGSQMQDNALIMTLMCGQGLAHATLSIIPQEYGIPNAQIYPMIVVTVIILTNIVTSIGPFLINRSNKKIHC